jgi:hypothetical protein
MDRLTSDVLRHVFHADAQRRIGRNKDTLPALCLLAQCSTHLRDALLPVIPTARHARRLARAAQQQLLTHITAIYSTPPSSITITWVGQQGDNLNYLINPGGPGRPHSGFVRFSVAIPTHGAATDFVASMNFEDTILNGAHITIAPIDERRGRLSMRCDDGWVYLSYCRGVTAAAEHLMQTILLN